MGNNTGTDWKKIGNVLKQIGKWVYSLRGVLLAIPVGIGAVMLALRNMRLLPEVVGINLREAGSADNAGNRMSNVPVVENGPTAYFATVPVREMVKALKEAGISAGLSFSAGAFVCNDVLYTLLHHYNGSPTQVGFIHVPFLPEQAKPGVASLPLETITAALEVAIGAI